MVFTFCSRSGDKYDNDPDLTEDNDDLDTSAKKSSSWWSYLIPFHYFA